MSQDMQSWSLAFFFFFFNLCDMSERKLGFILPACMSVFMACMRCTLTPTRWMREGWRLIPSRVNRVNLSSLRVYRFLRYGAVNFSRCLLSFFFSYMTSII